MVVKSMQRQFRLPTAWVRSQEASINQALVPIGPADVRNRSKILSLSFVMP
jgi:hypothetical protein